MEWTKHRRVRARREDADPRTLWDASFTLFWGAHAISEAGSRVTYIVAPVLVFQLTGSALNTGVLVALEGAPYLVFGLLAGAVADRSDRRRLMVGCNVLQTALLASVPVASAAGALTVAQIYVVALVSASLFVWFDAANFGALPSIVGRDLLVEANSAISVASSLLAIAGPALGGALAATIGAANAIALDAASYALAAVALMLVRKPFSSGARRDRRGLRSTVATIAADIAEGFRYLWHHRLVRVLTLLGAGVSFTGGAVTGLLVVYAVRALGTSDSGAQIGLLFSAAAAGALAASVLLPILSRRFPVGWITLAGLTIDLASVASLALVTGFVQALALIFVQGGAQTLVIINAIALRQRVTPDHLQSRVNVTARMIAWGGMPFGAACAGALAQYFSIRTTLFVIALGVGLSTLVGWLSPLRESTLAADVDPADGAALARRNTA